VLEPEPQDAHGDTGLQGPVFTECHVSPLEVDYLEWYKEQLEHNDKVTIVAIGPLTNIAQLIIKYPHLVDRIDKICLMGGSRGLGNISKYGEFNIYADPHGAKVVFESGIPIYMSDLGICDECRIAHKCFEDLKGKGRVYQLGYDILAFYSIYDKVRGNSSSPVFDLIPVVQLAHPEWFELQECSVEVIVDGEETRGQTVVKEGNGVYLLKHCFDMSKITETFVEGFELLERIYG
ncbi:MAG: nucleoside hydrolase, partial [Erysipelotrichaceae bacterium]|nr:nucleoside hydrolase [Erysipelotrichaceae bacterium]